MENNLSNDNRTQLINEDVPNPENILILNGNHHQNMRTNNIQTEEEKEIQKYFTK